MEESLKIDYSLEQISETDEEILYRVSWTVFGKYFEHWFTEKKKNND